MPGLGYEAVLGRVLLSGLGISVHLVLNIWAVGMKAQPLVAIAPVTTNGTDKRGDIWHTYYLRSLFREEYKCLID